MVSLSVAANISFSTKCSALTRERERERQRKSEREQKRPREPTAKVLKNFIDAKRIVYQYDKYLYVLEIKFIVFSCTIHLALFVFFLSLWSKTSYLFSHHSLEMKHYRFIYRFQTRQKDVLQMIILFLVYQGIYQRKCRVPLIFL